METIAEKLFASSVPFDDFEGPPKKSEVKTVGEPKSPEPVLTPEDLDSPAEIIRKCDLHWLHGTEKFYRRDGDSYLQLTLAGLKRHLTDLGIGKKTEPGEVSPVQEKVVTRLESKAHSLDWAGNLAGHAAGLDNVAGKKILVLEPLRLPDPKKGDWPTIRLVFETILGVPVYGETQLLQLYGWLKIACLGFIKNEKRFGQAFVMVGPPDSFKNSIQDFIFTPLFGDRCTDALS